MVRGGGGVGGGEVRCWMKSAREEGVCVGVSNPSSCGLYDNTSFSLSLVEVCSPLYLQHQWRLICFTFPGNWQSVGYAGKIATQFVRGFFPVI